MRFFFLFLTMSTALFPFARVEAQDAGSVMVITAPNATLYLAPSENRKSRTVLARGRRVEAAGRAENGFIPIATRGTKAWIRAGDVEAEAPTAGEFLQPVEPRGRPRQARAPRRSSPLGLHRLTFDLGASSGSVNDVSYTEVGVGLNAYFTDWLAWRNAVFGRFVSGGTNVYGLDTSVRGILDLSGSVAGLTFFAGPGFRFVNEGFNTPFAEGGVVLRVGGISLGGGAKVLLNSIVRSGTKNDTQYFIIIAGGGSL